MRRIRSIVPGSNHWTRRELMGTSLGISVLSSAAAGATTLGPPTCPELNRAQLEQGAPAAMAMARVEEQWGELLRTWRIGESNT